MKKVIAAAFAAWILLVTRAYPANTNAKAVKPAISRTVLSAASASATASYGTITPR